jgi:hypothetical protein
MKNVSKILVVGLSLCISATAWAGLRLNAPNVYIQKNSDGSGNAEGSLSVAYNSPDTSQSIGCMAHLLPTGSYSTNCSATDATGVTAQCVSSSADFARMATSMNSDSVVRFIWNSSGTCVELDIKQSSAFPPKK